MLKFGTDGVRGQFGTELTLDYVSALGRALGKVLQCELVVIGRDTRESGILIERAITQALTSLGVEVHLIGVAPTPAIAFVGSIKNAVSLAITASHNPYTDNGVKIFASGGYKLSDDLQAAIEKQLAIELQLTSQVTTTATNKERPDYLQQYCEMLKASVEKDCCRNLRIVLDCANGAFSDIAPKVFAELGALVNAINIDPDGQNINHLSGATHVQGLAQMVREVDADFGVAFDGDGDRMIAVDNNGKVVDGDHLLAISAIAMKHQGSLRNDAVAVTVMTNIGFYRAMQQAGIKVITTPVGDRSILVALEQHDLSLGGEQSGHIIYRDMATTGDGLLAAIQLACLVAKSNQQLSQIADQTMTSFPQVLLNVSIAKMVVSIEEFLANEIRQAQDSLGSNGRVLVRSSGTEPLIRVMVEAESLELAESVARTLADAITVRLG